MCDARLQTVAKEEQRGVEPEWQSGDQMLLCREQGESTGNWCFSLEYDEVLLCSH